MCDTFVIKRKGGMVFAKNSDREPGEAQLVVRIPPASGSANKRLAATYITIDQAGYRHGVLLSKPFWMWGAEMGANDRGVVIGNEAVFTRVMEKKASGLIGMDLVRLGLERGDTAEHALHVITTLLEAHGQGGVCGFRDKRFRYDNSFIIADPQNAWVLETAGRHWAAKKVTNAAAISNCLTISTNYDITSAGIEDFARNKGLLKGADGLDFRAAFEAPLMPFLARSGKRLQTANCAIRDVPDADAKAELSAVMGILRRHAHPDGVPAAGSNADICMHAAGPVRRSQTCGSMVSRLTDPASGKTPFIHFFTGTSAPCLSVFKPATVSGDRPFYVLNTDEKTVEGSLWRRFEPVHRQALFSRETRDALRKSARQAEDEMLFRLVAYLDHPDRQRALNDADHAVRDWSERQIASLSNSTFQYPLSPYGWYWKKMNRLDGIANR